MAFIDEVEIYASAGNGGNGVIRWAHTKEKARGGPSGGDGGNGGDVILVGVHDYAALEQYRSEKRFHAKNGEAGKGELKRGADGDPIHLLVPIGTQIRVLPHGKEYEITKEGEEIVVFRGGKGGLGNARFKSSTNQNPFNRTEGKPGKEGRILLNLKLIADIGFIGLPNAGKSSLLNALTRAKSKVGNYPFTTLEPNLGDYHGTILADIPGLIEGASSGRGLGMKFLKHVERTGILVHLVSVEQEDPLRAYREVRKEIEAFGRTLLHKPEVIVVSKIDLTDANTRETIKQELIDGTGKEVLTVSAHDPASVKAFADTLMRLVEKSR